MLANIRVYLTVGNNSELMHQPVFWRNVSQYSNIFAVDNPSELIGRLIARFVDGDLANIRAYLTVGNPSASSRVLANILEY